MQPPGGVRLNDNLNDLPPKKKRAIEALTTCGNITQAAEVSGITRDTLYRWMQEPAFQEAMKNAEREALRELSRRLVELAQQATSTLQEVMTHPQSPPNARVQAARAVLDNLLRLREMIDFENRISHLEEEIINVNIRQTNSAY